MVMMRIHCEIFNPVSGGSVETILVFLVIDRCNLVSNEVHMRVESW
jgi:hypothetical protein